MKKVLTIILAAALLTACSESTTSLSPLQPPLRTIFVLSSTNHLVVGESMAVQATAQAADGSPFHLTTVEWTSSDVAVATVTATGPLTAKVQTISEGSVSITASVESHSGQLDLSVTAPTAPSDDPWLAFIWSRE